MRPTPIHLQLLWTSALLVSASSGLLDCPEACAQCAARRPLLPELRRIYCSMCQECRSGRRQQGEMSCDMARCFRIDYPTTTTCAPPTHRPPPPVCPEPTPTYPPQPPVCPEPVPTHPPPPVVCPVPTPTQPPQPECPSPPPPPRPRPTRPRPTQPPSTTPQPPSTPPQQQPACNYMPCWMPMCCGNFRCANTDINNFRRTNNNINNNMVPSTVVTTEDESMYIYPSIPKEQGRYRNYRRSRLSDVDIMNVL